MKLADYYVDNLLILEDSPLVTWEMISEEETDYIAVKTETYQVYAKKTLLVAFLENGCQALDLSKIKPMSGYAVVSEEKDDADDAVIALLKKEKKALICSAHGHPLFILENSSLVATYAEARCKMEFYCKILDDTEEEIFVSNARGIVVYMNPHSEKICGFRREECVGYHVSELEEKGVFSESMTVEVISNHCKVEKTVEVASGRHIISTAIPIFNEEKELEFVLCTSKDIKEINELMRKNAQIAQDLDDTKKEVANLQNRVIGQKNYVFESHAMQEIKKTIMKIAPTDVTVLIEGETGTGKEVTADLLHSLSKRSRHPFMKVNCGLIPAELLESELFGYMPGAFSGALKEGKIGIIEAGNKGTIFLDEIGEMPWLLQVKLLEFLQDRRIMRIGSVKKIPIDVRVIAATNRNLQKMIENGEFRKDLYYRLNVMPLHLPPLQARREDVKPLAKMFLQKFNQEYHCHKQLTDGVFQGLMNYSWPGNVRELMHVIERFVVSGENDEVNEDQLREVLGKPMKSQQIICTGMMPLMKAREELDQILVTEAVERSGSTHKAAALLGVNQSTIVRILKRTNN